MANHHFKITVGSGGKAWVNVIDGENDSTWEIRHPQTEAYVDIPTGERRWVAVQVLGSPGTNFTLSMNDDNIMEGETDNEGKYSNMVRVRG